MLTYVPAQNDKADGGPMMTCKKSRENTNKNHQIIVMRDWNAHLGNEDTALWENTY